MNRRILITGCSGGGKSSLLAELTRRGHPVVEEPGRRVIAQQVSSAGSARPWINLGAFARLCLTTATCDHSQAGACNRWTFFDRGMVDAAVALRAATGAPLDDACRAFRYHERVFVAPPWPEIFKGDDGRRHGFEESTEEYGRIVAALPLLGYVPTELPRRSVDDRADWLLNRLG